MEKVEQSILKNVDKFNDIKLAKGIDMTLYATKDTNGYIFSLPSVFPMTRNVNRSYNHCAGLMIHFKK